MSQRIGVYVRTWGAGQLPPDDDEDIVVVNPPVVDDSDTESSTDVESSIWDGLFEPGEDFIPLDDFLPAS